MKKYIVWGIAAFWLVWGASSAQAGVPGTQKWVYNLGSPSYQRTCAIAADGNILVGTGDFLFAVKPDGTYGWNYYVGGFGETIITTPAVGASGTIYFGVSTGAIYQMYSNGGFKDKSGFGIIDEKGLALGAGESYYFVGGGYIRRQDVSGGTSNYFYTGSTITAPPAVGPDGTVYVATLDNKLYARLPNLNSKWTYLGVSYISHIAVGFDGIIYTVTADKLMALNASGVFQWSYTAGDSIQSSPAIGPDGTIYVGCNDRKIYAIRPDGTLKWAYLTQGNVQSSPALGADGTIYAGSLDNKLYAINADGTLAWSFNTGGDITSAPAVGDDGTVYVHSNDGNLYAVYSSSPEPAQSAWPMYQRDARRTGNTAYKWAFLNNADMRSSPALRSDGTIYVGGYSDGKVYAISPSGTQKWAFATGGVVYSSPALSAGPGFHVFVGSGDNKLYCLDASSGAKMWDYPTGGPILSSPAVAADGNVIVGSDDKKVHKVNVDTGTEMWTHTTGGAVRGSPAIGPDGTIYVGSNDYNLYALTPGGELKWTYYAFGPSEWEHSSPAVGKDGTIYVATSSLRAVRPDGTEKWAYGTGVASSPAIGHDGTIYVGFLNYNNSTSKLYAITPNGTEKWNYVTAGEGQSSPAIGADGLIYFGAADAKLHVLRPDGSLVWAYPVGDDPVSNTIESSPAIGPDGTVYVGSMKNLHAFHCASKGLARSFWPMFRHDPQHTGRWSTIPGNISFLSLLLLE